MPGPDFANPFLARRRLPWALLVLYMVLALVLSALVPDWLPVGEAQNLNDGAAPWQRSVAVSVSASNGGTLWQSAGNGPGFASRLIHVAEGAGSLRLRACRGDGAAEAGAATLMIASENNGALDFNRAYRLWEFDSLAPGECASDNFSRWEGDGRAVLQLQFLIPEKAVELTALNVLSQRENPAWRMIRQGMLGLGLALVVWLFAQYLRCRPRILALGGLLVVAGILFGVCVSVPLKADIFAIMTGGRSLASPAGSAALLETAFPIGGFSIFTQLHAVFFASACFALTLVERRAWLDLVLLALVTETLQLFVPGRGPGLSDSIVDLSGVALGLISVFLVLRSERIRLLLEHQGVNKDISGL